MTDVARAPVSKPSSSVRVLERAEYGTLSPLLARDPVKHCFAASRLPSGGLRSEPSTGQIWALETAGQVTSAVLAGANLVPLETDAASRQAFADFGIAQGRRCSSVLGPADEVLDLWARLSPAWGAAREVRPDQPLLVADGSPAVAPDPMVRRVYPSELEAILPACVAMFTEEVGVSPMAGGAGPSYRKRVAALISQNRSYARFRDGKPIFKAEIGAISAGVCQIQGVWVDPDYRGQGIGSAGVAAVVDYARRFTPVVSLYVNAFNAAALRSYRNAGFRTVGRYATVLF